MVGVATVDALYDVYIDLYRFLWVTRNGYPYARQLFRALEMELRAIHLLVRNEGELVVPVDAREWKEVQREMLRLGENVRRETDRLRTTITTPGSTQSMRTLLGLRTLDSLPDGVLGTLLRDIQTIYLNKDAIAKGIKRGDDMRKYHQGQFAFITAAMQNYLEYGNRFRIDPKSLPFILERNRSTIDELYTQLDTMRDALERWTGVLNQVTARMTSRDHARITNPYDSEDQLFKQVQSNVQELETILNKAVFQGGVAALYQVAQASVRYDSGLPILEIHSMNPKNMIELISVPPAVVGSDAALSGVQPPADETKVPDPYEFKVPAPNSAEVTTARTASSMGHVDTPVPAAFGHDEADYDQPESHEVPVASDIVRAPSYGTEYSSDEDSSPSDESSDDGYHEDNHEESVW